MVTLQQVSWGSSPPLHPRPLPSLHRGHKQVSESQRIGVPQAISLQPVLPIFPETLGF